METVLTQSYVRITGEKENSFFRTMPDCLKHYANIKPRDEAVVFVSTDGKREIVSWFELYERSCKVAKYFLRLGIQKGEVVAVNIQNCPEWLYATFGAMMAGAIPVSVSFTNKDGSDLITLMEQLKNCSMLIMEPGQANMNWDIIRPQLDDFSSDGKVKSQKMPYLRCLIGLAFNETNARVLNFNDLLLEAHLDEVLPEVDPTDISSLFLTSGSTGVPKVVAHTHDSLIGSYIETNIEILDPKHKHYNDRPFSWIGGYPFSLLTGQTRVTISGRSEPPEDKVSFMTDVIERERCSSLLALPPIVVDLMKRQDELSSDWPVVVIMCIGQPTKKHISECVGKICQSFVCEYGSTEVISAALSTIKHPDDYTDYSCGKPVRIPGLEMKIVNENGTVVPLNTRGEVYVRSPFMFKEYFNDPENTKAVKTDDGWFRTNDIGRLTDNGDLFVEGRKSNMILSGGLNVAPEILEHVIETFPDVKSTIIVPVHDDMYYQVLCACVVKKTGCDVTEEKLCRYLNDFQEKNPGFFKVLPKYYLFFDRFPETTSGKWHRKEIEKIAIQRLKMTK